MNWGPAASVDNGRLSTTDVMRASTVEAMIAEGQEAPDFALPDQTGAVHRLSEVLKRGPAVVYFYPKDETRGCTAQACSFRDAYEDFREAGAEVIGISADGPESHRAFREHHRLPFILLSDSGGQVAKAFGVKKTLGLLPGRATFLIDREGIVRLAFSSQMKFNEHCPRALEVLKTLA